MIKRHHNTIMIFYGLLLTTLIVCITYHFWKKRNLPPGPWGLPIVGYLPWLDPVAPYQTLTELSRKYGELCGLTLGNVYSVILTNPKTIKAVFSMETTTGRAPLYLTHGIMQGYGLICAEGELWKNQRKFTHQCLRQLGASRIGPQRSNMEILIKEHVSNLIKSIEAQGEVPLDPLDKLRHALGSVINVIVFGKCWSEEDKVWKWLQFLQEEGTKLIGVAGPLNFLPFLRFLPKYERTMRFLIEGKNKTHEFYQRLIQEQMELLELATNENPKNVIQAFLLERKKQTENVAKEFYNDIQFHHLLADIFGASLDTTLTTLRWYLLFLAKYPQVQSAVRTDLKDILNDRLPSLEDVPHLPFVEASICETQRIRPVVPIGIPHGATEDITIDGFNIPKGTMIVPLQWALHMDQKVWKDPEVFNPSRFIDQEGKVRRVDGFMPFQIGKRMCVGDELARMLLFLFGATIISKFEISLEDVNVDMTGECGITLTPKPHKLCFRRAQ